jgi:hypothetical protein
VKPALQEQSHGEGEGSGKERAKPAIPCSANGDKTNEHACAKAPVAASLHRQLSIFRAHASAIGTNYMAGESAATQVSRFLLGHRDEVSRILDTRILAPATGGKVPFQGFLALVRLLTTLDENAPPAIKRLSSF